MKRKRFSVEQLVAVLKEAELGVPVGELIRQVGITEQTPYRWKKQFGSTGESIADLNECNGDFTTGINSAARLLAITH